MHYEILLLCRFKDVFPWKGNKLADQLSAHLYFGLNSEPWKYWNILSFFPTANIGWRKWHQFLCFSHWTVNIFLVIAWPNDFYKVHSRPEIGSFLNGNINSVKICWRTSTYFNPFINHQHERVKQCESCLWAPKSEFILRHVSGTLLSRHFNSKFCDVWVKVY